MSTNALDDVVSRLLDQQIGAIFQGKCDMNLEAPVEEQQPAPLALVEVAEGRK